VAAAAAGAIRPAALFEPATWRRWAISSAASCPRDLAGLPRPARPATVETLAMATAGIALAVLLAVPLGWC
jgi:hypothetical protein